MGGFLRRTRRAATAATRITDAQECRKSREKILVRTSLVVEPHPDHMISGTSPKRGSRGNTHWLVDPVCNVSVLSDERMQLDFILQMRQLYPERP